MNYGLMIKTARKKLNLVQHNLSSDNLSSANVSDIEKGKAKLVTSKGLLIYENLVTQSLDKKIDIELDFDELLNNNQKYIELKEAWETIIRLRSSKENETPVQPFELDKYRLFALKSNIGLLKYFLFHAIADLSSADKEFRAKVLFNSLDFLKWLNFKEIYEKYDHTLKELTQVSFELALYSKLLDYYIHYEQNCIDLEINIEPRIYFNIGLIYRRMGENAKAYKYIERYIDFSRKLDLDKQINGLNLLGNIALLMNDHIKASSHYIAAYNLSIQGALNFEEMVCIGNLIYLHIHESSIDKNLLSEYLERLEYLVPDNIEGLLQKYSIYTNMAIAYFKIEHYKKYQDFKNLALRSSENDSTTLLILNDLWKNKCVKDVNAFIEILNQIHVDQLSEKDLIALYSILLQMIASGYRSNQIEEFIKKNLGGNS